jgi:hypothetical protein
MIESVTGSLGGEVSLPPPMSGDTLNDGTGTWVATYSNPPPSLNTHPAWKAFSGFNSNFFNSGALQYNQAGNYQPTSGTTNTTVSNTGSYDGEWIQIEFPTPFTITKYAIGGRNDNTPTGWDSFGQYCSPDNFKIFASNDGNTWVEADSVTTAGIPNPNITIKKEFILPVPTEGRFFRLACNKIAGGKPNSPYFLNIGTLEYIVVNDGNCPVGGCLRATTKMDVQGDLNVSVNTEIGGSLTVGGVLQDTQLGAFLKVTANTGAEVIIDPTTPVYGPISVLANGVSVSISDMFAGQTPLIDTNMNFSPTFPLTNLIIFPGLYRVVFSFSYQIDGKSAICFRIAHIRSAISTVINGCLTEDAKDEFRHCSVEAIVECIPNDSFDISFQTYTAAVSLTGYVGTINVQRILSNG